MERILVASDLSERSRRALRRALSLAKQFGTKLDILYVADDDKPAGFVEEERLRAVAGIRDMLDMLGREGLSSSPSIISKAGDPFRVIVDEANRSEADLVVMGAHRKRLLGDIFTGTTIERVMRMGGRPVLMVNRDSATSYGNVLAAVDLSDASANAIRMALKLGLMNPASSAAVHGFLPVGEAMLYYVGVERERVEEHVAVSASEARAALRQFLNDNGFGKMANILLVEKASPFEAIENAVNKMQPDLLVIGTRGHSGLKRVLLGSVADQVLRQIECDILAVPPERAS
jgi:universal stress protein E